jgi:hypothetical protein
MGKAAASRTESRAAVEARLAAAQDILAAEVTAIQSGEDWQRFLEFQAKLHAYSPRNVLLIAAQHHLAFTEGRVASPDPGFVAGFATWRALGRTVERGQRGYGILAPCRAERRYALRADGEARLLRAGDHPGPDERVESHRSLVGFRLEHVFSVHQTAGVPLPEPPLPELLAGAAPPGLTDAVTRLIKGAGFQVGEVDSAAAIGGANGLTSFAERRVSVRADMDEAARAKTLLHEAAHALLHGDPPGSTLPRALKEVEAESVAFVVARAHGMDTGSYSFPYVAVWAGRDGAKAVAATQARVARAATVLLAASPAPHASGGRPPGVEAALAARRDGALATTSPAIAGVLDAGAVDL